MSKMFVPFKLLLALLAVIKRSGTLHIGGRRFRRRQTAYILNETNCLEDIFGRTSMCAVS